jgi:hypothetical protein
MTRTMKSTQVDIARRALALLAVGVLLFWSAPASADPTQLSGVNAANQSGNGSQGIIELNQDAGDSNNQGNAVAIAATASDTSAAIASVVLESEQRASASTSEPTVQSNTISGSFNNTSGIVQLNQTTGQGNVQLNAIAVAFAAGADFSPALTDVQLHAVAAPVSGGGTSSAAVGSTNSLSDSFNGFKGIAQVQQIAGDSNVVVNVVAIASSGGPL